MSKKTIGTWFSFLCCLVYFTSYLTRINYAAILVEIIDDFSVSKEIGSIAVTGSFITYGLGQLFSGYLGDRIPPRTMITGGLLATSAVNLSMALLPGIRPMTVLWCFNGFFQAMLWPPLVRIMAENLEDRAYTRTCAMVSAAASAATILIYLCSPLLISLSGWRTVFVTSGSAGIVTAFLWLFATRRLTSSSPSSHIARIGSANETGKVSFGQIASSGIFILMAVIILQGILRDGITTWMPIYIREVFSLGSASSILTTVILPIFSIMSVSVASFLHGKIRNEVLAAAILFGGGLFASLLMTIFFSSSVVAAALLMAVITGCMHGVNLMLISRLPVNFVRYGKVSTISGVLNACTYVGSALSTYGFAVFSEQFGWKFIIWSWVGVCFLGTSLSLVSLKFWNRFMKSPDTIHSAQGESH